MQVYTASAAFPGQTYLRALAQLQGCREWFGELCFDKVQICPQHQQRLDQKVIEELKEAYPQTQFRLHANCWVHTERNIDGLDLSNLTQENISLFEPLAKAHQQLNGDVYSLHAGYIEQCNREDLSDHIRRAEDLFDCPVAVEPLYPSEKNYHLSSFDDLKWLLDQDLPFALDLSHYQIMARHEQYDIHAPLLIDLLESPNCLEIHVSDNNGQRDAHATLQQEPWYWSFLVDAYKRNPSLNVFTEGNQRTNPLQLKKAHDFQRNMRESLCTTS